jgi:hypothetical protein
MSAPFDPPAQDPPRLLHGGPGIPRTLQSALGRARQDGLDADQQRRVAARLSLVIGPTVLGLGALGQGASAGATGASGVTSAAGATASSAVGASSVGGGATVSTGAATTGAAAAGASASTGAGLAGASVGAAGVGLGVKLALVLGATAAGAGAAVYVASDRPSRALAPVPAPAEPRSTQPAPMVLPLALPLGASPPTATESTPSASASAETTAARPPHPAVGPRRRLPARPAEQPASAAAPSVASTESPAATVSELELLDRAHQAVKTDAAAALRLVDEHARRFPQSALVQEREALAIEALVGAGRAEAARGRANAFLDRYPTSALRRRIERSIKP